MDRFFFEQAVARKLVYASILLAWLALILSNTSSPALKQVIIAAVAYPVVGIITYYFMGFSLAFIWLFTNKLGIYKLMYWGGLLVVATGLWSMPAPEMRESDLIVILGLAISLSARSIYFDLKDGKKKKN